MNEISVGFANGFFEFIEVGLRSKTVEPIDYRVVNEFIRFAIETVIFIELWGLSDI